MLLKYFLLFLSLFLSVRTDLNPKKNINDFGPFILNIEELVTCRGPKSRNLTIVAMEVNKNTAMANYTFLYDTKVDEIKMNVFYVKDEKSEHLYNHKMNDPCKHFMLSSLLEQFFKTNNYCMVKKGTYENKADVAKLIETFLGNSFFYGKYIFKVLLLAKTGNIGCFRITLAVSQKK